MIEKTGLPCETGLPCQRIQVTLQKWCEGKHCEMEEFDCGSQEPDLLEEFYKEAVYFDQELKWLKPKQYYDHYVKPKKGKKKKSLVS